jgi:membrane protein DedA with SNARE-associated domain
VNADLIVPLMALGLYGGVMLAPFVQEDAAVIGAAAAAAAGTGEPILLFLALVVGLSASDVWKYWLGRLARTNAWARKFTEKPGVAKAKNGVLNRLGLTLLVARFVPGTRIPLYIASGVFEAPALKFTAYVIATGILYAGLAFALFQTLGKAAGEHAGQAAAIAAVVVGVTVLTVSFVRGRQARAA